MFYLPTSKFQLLEMDTDSLYMAVSEPSLDDCIKQGYEGVFAANKSDWFATTDHDKRMPGLFKKKWEGEAMVCLNSKTYYCFAGELGGKDKWASKGAQKRDNRLTFERYKRVLDTRCSYLATNRGFRTRHGGIQSYTEKRSAFTWFYPKRRVENERIFTTPLTL